MADPHQQQRREEQRVSGISAAAIQGAKEGDPRQQQQQQQLNPDEIAAKMAGPHPGMTDPRSPAVTGGVGGTEIGGVSSTNPETGVTGQVREEQEDEEQEWRRAGGGSGDDADRTGTGENPGVAGPAGNSSDEPA